MKSYALCPWFADTALLRQTATPDLVQRRAKTRCLTVNEVGNAFDLVLDRDVSGGAYGVFPDAPLMDLPNPNAPVFFAFAVVGKMLGASGVKVDVMGWPHVLVGVMGLLLVAYLLLSFLFGLVF